MKKMKSVHLYNDTHELSSQMGQYLILKHWKIKKQSNVFLIVFTKKKYFSQISIPDEMWVYQVYDTSLILNVSNGKVETLSNHDLKPINH